MDKHTKKIKRRYNRVSKVYDLFETPMEMMALKKWREEVMSNLYGNVLEVGVGTGKNIAFYPDDVTITAIDFSEKMLEKAKKKATLHHKEVRFELMDVQKLPFDDDTFDCVFTTCVFCSVPDPVRGFKEIQRVCKKDGKIILVEHVRSEKKLLGLLMDVMNPITVSLYGANINRRTVETLKQVGFNHIQVTNLWKDIVKKIVITNN